MLFRGMRGAASPVGGGGGNFQWPRGLEKSKERIREELFTQVYTVLSELHLERLW